MNESAPTCDPMAMLGMMQLADTFFPSGLYTLSHGLESLIQAGEVSTACELESLIEDFINNVNGPADAVATAGAAGAVRGGDVALVVAIDRHLRALKLPHEAAMASTRAGKRLLGLARNLSADPALLQYSDQVTAGGAPGNFAIGLGALCGAWGIDPKQAALVELYSFATGLLGVALRTMRLDHMQTQAILARMKPLIASCAAEAASTPYQEMRSFGPAIEIAQMRHQRAEVRLFAS